jgi:AcrR family transcriptional regulator
MRNVELTKQRILAAATEEFSEHGFAGARVDRIAEQAGANKSLIYSYFGNKEALFAAVYQAIMRQVVQDVTMDAADLPGYLGRRLDWQYRNPALSRIALWGTLELADFPEITGAYAVRQGKLQRIADAQRDGLIDSSLAPSDILDLIDSLARPTQWLGPHGPDDLARFEQYKRTAVAALKVFLSQG